MSRAMPLALLCACLTAPAVAPARDWGGMYVPLDAADLALLEQAADRVDAATGEAAEAPVSWENPKNGTRGSIQAARRFEHDGSSCVQYRLRVEVSGYEPFVSTPVLCQSDGEWRLVNKAGKRS